MDNELHGYIDWICKAGMRLFEHDRDQIES